MIAARAMTNFGSKQGFSNFHVINIQELVIDIFRCVKGLSPPSPPHYEWEIYVEKCPIYHKKFEGSR